MIREILISAGDKVFAGGTITETSKADISGTTVVVAVLPESTRPGPDTTVTAPDILTSPTPSQRTAKVLISTDNATPGVRAQVWARITDTPEQEWLLLETFDPL
jgi:hypothetical protein